MRLLTVCALETALRCRARIQATAAAVLFAISSIVLPTLSSADAPAPTDSSQYPAPAGTLYNGGTLFNPLSTSSPLYPTLNYPFSTCSTANLPTPNLSEPIDTAIEAANQAVNALQVEPLTDTQKSGLDKLSNDIATSIRTSTRPTELDKVDAAAKAAYTAASKALGNDALAKKAQAAVHDYLAQATLYQSGTSDGIAQTGANQLNYNGVQTYLLRLRACELLIDRRFSDVYQSRGKRLEQVDYDLQAAHAFCRIPDASFASGSTNLVFSPKPSDSNDFTILNTPPQTAASSDDKTKWNNYRIAVVNNYNQLYELLSFCQNVATTTFPANTKRFLCSAGSPTAALTTLGVSIIATGGLSVTLKAVAVALASLAGGCGGGSGTGMNANSNASATAQGTTTGPPTVSSPTK